MENENVKKRKLKLNFFDLVIIVVVVALAGAYAVHRIGGGSAVDTSSVKTRELVYTLQIDDLNENTLPLVHKGDELMDKVKKYEIGTVEKVEFFPFERTTEDKENGRYIMVKDPERYSAALTVEVKCQDDGKALIADSGFKIRVGQSVSVVGPGYSGGGYITSIERGEE